MSAHHFLHILSPGVTHFEFETTPLECENSASVGEIFYWKLERIPSWSFHENLIMEFLKSLSFFLFILSVASAQYIDCDNMPQLCETEQPETQPPIPPETRPP